MADTRFYQGKVLASKRPQSTSLRTADAVASCSGVSAATQLVNGQWELCTDDVLKTLTENPDFLVVGILGPQGTGKSTIMNSLCGHTGDKSEFPVATMENITRNRHCTSTLEIRVNPQDRMIAIDTPPLFSASVLLDLMELDRPPLGLTGSTGVRSGGRRSMPFEAAQQLMASQMACFLFSVCHVVLVTATDLLRPDLQDLLQLVEMCCQSLPDPSTAQATPQQSSDQPAHIADAVFVMTGLQQEQLHSSFMQLHHKALTTAMAGTRFCRTADITAAPLLHPRMHTLTTQSPRPRPGVNFFPIPRALKLLPHTPSTHPMLAPPLLTTPSSNAKPDPLLHPTATTPGNPQQPAHHSQSHSQSSQSQNQSKASSAAPPPSNPAVVAPQNLPPCFTCDPPAVQMLRDLVLSHPRRLFARPVSERVWLKGCERVWESIRRSADLGGVYAHLLSTSCEGAAGWTLGR